MSDRRPSSTKIRRECFERWKYRCHLSQRWLIDCHLCGLPIDVIKEGPHSWEAEHVLRRSLNRGDDDDIENIKPAHVSCHADKTREDVTENAKGKRVESNHFGFKKQRRPMPGSKASGWRIKMDGTREKR